MIGCELLHGRPRPRRGGAATDSFCLGCDDVAPTLSIRALCVRRYMCLLHPNTSLYS